MLSETLHKALTDDATTADAGEARRFTRHLVSLTATKSADGLIDPKLILSWVMGALGAPGYLIGALVPVRESGALLPQIALARWIEASTTRKFFWAAGSLIQGLAALAIALAIFTLEGAVAGWAILAGLAVLSLARAACSASYKDIAARTIQKGARGTVSGAAGTVAAGLAIAFAAALASGLLPLKASTIAAAITVAGGLWIFAALVFAGLSEPGAEVEDETGELDRLLKPLRDDEFRTFIAVRALLISTALAPPFLVMMSQPQAERALGNLGILLLATAAATILSSYVWGRLSDRSSRRTLIYSGALAALTLGAAAGAGWSLGTLATPLAAAVIFTAQIAYEGVRAGRKTHLTDMDAQGQKALYTALSNTMIGVFLLIGGAFGWIADSLGPAVALALLAVMAGLGALFGLGLSEVQDD